MLKLHGVGDVDFDSGGSGDEAEDGASKDGNNIDIHDIDFKLNNNLAKLEASSKKNRRFTRRDVNLMKLIICSGLYPQVCVADESNPWRKVTEQVFHSKNKQFLSLHPTAVFSLQPDFLEAFYDENCKKDNTPEGQRLNCKEFLAYMSLLETKKPYIVNSMMVPVLQTLFLLSPNIGTNSDCSKVVVDDWIELSFKDGVKAKSLLCDVVRLRKAWDTLLEEKLFLHEDDPHTLRKRLTRIKSLQEVVALKLAEFLDADIDYEVRRLLSADSKYMYVNTSSHGADNTTVMDADGASTSATNTDDKTTKGGHSVTPYLTFGCLRDDLSMAVASNRAEYLVEHYHCPNCHEHLIGTVVDRMKHNEACGILDEGEGETADHGVVEDVNCEDEEDSPNKPKNNLYFCEVCQRDLNLSPVEILKHKSSHK